MIPSQRLQLQQQLQKTSDIQKGSLPTITVSGSKTSQFRPSTASDAVAVEDVYYADEPSGGVPVWALALGGLAVAGLGAYLWMR